MTQVMQDYAAQIDKVRLDILFDDGGDREAFDRTDGKAAQFFLLAVSHLETAHRFMRLAALEAEAVA